MPKTNPIDVTDLSDLPPAEARADAAILGTLARFKAVAHTMDCPPECRCWVVRRNAGEL